MKTINNSKIKEEIFKEILNHPIVLKNDFCEDFSENKLDIKEVRNFTIQFSVFSHFFIIAQLLKVTNSPTLNEMRIGKEILMNELGVTFKTNMLDNDTVNGGTFTFSSSHFEWLLRFSKNLGLGFNDLGKMRHATKSTKHFCLELQRLYGSEDAFIASASSFAIETWAAAGFWKQLIKGLKKFSHDSGIILDLSFFEWHDNIEDKHANCVEEELDEIINNLPEFDHIQFIKNAKEMLDAVSDFWEGLRKI